MNVVVRPAPILQPVMSRSALPWWTLAVTYYVLACLMHLQFSLWLVRQRNTVLGPMALADLMPVLVIAGGAALAIWLVRGLRNSPRAWLTSAFWLLWLGAVVLIDLNLTFSVNEYAHYPQYAVLAWLLARAMDPERSRWYVGRVVFWVTLMGIGDEVLQYLWITTSYSHYLDFNDFLVNLVAAGAGMLLYYGPATTPRAVARYRRPVAELLVAGVISLLVLVGLQTGRIAQNPTGTIVPGGIVELSDGSRRLYLQRGPDFYGSWQSSKRHEDYFVMPPLPGLLLLVLAGLAFSAYGPLRSSGTALHGLRLGRLRTCNGPDTDSS